MPIYTTFVKAFNFGWSLEETTRIMDVAMHLPRNIDAIPNNRPKLSLISSSFQGTVYGISVTNQHTCSLPVKAAISCSV